jgi:hypothetical protein
MPAASPRAPGPFGPGWPDRTRHHEPGRRRVGRDRRGRHRRFPPDRQRRPGRRQWNKEWSPDSWLHFGEPTHCDPILPFYNLDSHRCSSSRRAAADRSDDNGWYFGDDASLHGLSGTTAADSDPPASRSWGRVGNRRERREHREKEQHDWDRKSDWCPVIRGIRRRGRGRLEKPPLGDYIPPQRR